MILVFFIIGFGSAILGALPLGASNIAVINTTLKHNTSQAMKITVAAGIAELLLSYYALHCNTVVKNFIDRNMWIQISIVIILLAIGAFLMFKRENNTPKPKRSRFKSNYLKGFALGLLNPPVLIYWIVVIGLINKEGYQLNLQTPLLILLLFFLGVYLGKTLTLHMYSKFSLTLKTKIQNINSNVNRITGALLVAIAVIQSVKLYAF